METEAVVGKRKEWRKIRKVAEALAAAHKKYPNADHFTTEKLRKFGAPPGNAARNTVRDHRYAMWISLKELGFKRAPFYESGSVWL